MFCFPIAFPQLWWKWRAGLHSVARSDQCVSPQIRTTSMWAKLQWLQDGGPSHRGNQPMNRELEFLNFDFRHLSRDYFMCSSSQMWLLGGTPHMRMPWWVQTRKKSRRFQDSHEFWALAWLKKGFHYCIFIYNINFKIEEHCREV